MFFYVPKQDQQILINIVLAKSLVKFHCTDTVNPYFFFKSHLIFCRLHYKLFLKGLLFII